MLLFLAGIVEQLDLAVEHIGKGDVRNACFGLMLTDNALELVLHQIVKDKRAEAGSWRYRDEPYPHETKLRKAFLGSFSDKVAFARLKGGLTDDVSQTFNTIHEYRNEIYHAGLAHEAILLSLARLYLDTVCAYLSGYRPSYVGWSSAQRMPERAKKYFKGHRSFPGGREDFAEACKALAAANSFDHGEVVQILADDLDQIVESMDTCIRVVADGVYVGQQTTRDQAVRFTQAWDFAFNEEGKAFAAERSFEGNVFELVDFLSAKYPFRYRRDPIPAWQAQAKRLRAKGDAHMALDHYQSFVKQTGSLRAALEQSAGAAEAEIEAASDRMRGK